MKQAILKVLCIENMDVANSKAVAVKFKISEASVMYWTTVSFTSSNM